MPRGVRSKERGLAQPNRGREQARRTVCVGAGEVAGRGRRDVVPPLLVTRCAAPSTTNHEGGPVGTGVPTGPQEPHRVRPATSRNPLPNPTFPIRPAGKFHSTRWERPAFLCAIAGHWSCIDGRQQRALAHHPDQTRASSTRRPVGTLQTAKTRAPPGMSSAAPAPVATSSGRPLQSQTVAGGVSGMDGISAVWFTTAAACWRTDHALLRACVPRFIRFFIPMKGQPLSRKQRTGDSR